MPTMQVGLQCHSITIFLGKRMPTGMTGTYTKLLTQLVACLEDQACFAWLDQLSYAERKSGPSWKSDSIHNFAHNITTCLKTAKLFLKVFTIMLRCQQKPVVQHK